MRVNIAFRIFLYDKHVTEGIATRSELDEIKDATGVDILNLDTDIKIPDMPGQLLAIESDSVLKREKALLRIF